jgi:hypothetical protein
MAIKRMSRAGRSFNNDLFRIAWQRLAAQAIVDGFGGAQYRRVFGDWLDAQRPANVKDFILRHA